MAPSQAGWTLHDSTHLGPTKPAQHFGRARLRAPCNQDADGTCVMLDAITVFLARTQFSDFDLTFLQPSPFTVRLVRFPCPHMRHHEVQICNHVQHESIASRFTVANERFTLHRVRIAACFAQPHGAVAYCHAAVVCYDRMILCIAYLCDHALLLGHAKYCLCGSH